MRLGPMMKTLLAAGLIGRICVAEEMPAGYGATEGATATCSAHADCQDGSFCATFTDAQGRPGDLTLCHSCGVGCQQHEAVDGSCEPCEECGAECLAFLAFLVLMACCLAYIVRACYRKSKKHAATRSATTMQKLLGLLALFATISTAAAPAGDCTYADTEGMPSSACRSIAACPHVQRAAHSCVPSKV